MFRDERPPLPEWVLDAYRQLAEQIRPRDGGLPIEVAKTLLITEATDQADVEYALRRLLPSVSVSLRGIAVVHIDLHAS